MKKYNIIVGKQPTKYIEKQPKHIQEAFEKWKDEKLLHSPHTEHDGRVKGLKYKGLQSYKKRFGKFRVLLTINDNEILIYIYQAQSRGQVYKK